MPLTELVEYFNQRITEQQDLKEYPLKLLNGRVESTFGGYQLASELHPIRSAENPWIIQGHDATLYADPPETSQSLMEKVFETASNGGVVNLDRLCRTIHMLNYLPISHESHYLFVHVHPRHLLGIKEDHGAYFEEIIFRCGLSPRRVVITVPVKPLYDHDFLRFRQGLKNYQNRSYSIALQFTEQANEPFTERYCIELLYRITPDFIRVEKGFFERLQREQAETTQSTSLLTVIHGLDTEILLEGIGSLEESLKVKGIRASLVKGDYYEENPIHPTLAKAS